MQKGIDQQVYTRYIEVGQQTGTHKINPNKIVRNEIKVKQKILKHVQSVYNISNKTKVTKSASTIPNLTKYIIT